jgi:hypothetical protein
VTLLSNVIQLRLKPSHLQSKTFFCFCGVFHPMNDVFIVRGRLLHRKQKMKPAGFVSGISIRIPTGIIEELFYSSARDPKICS